MKHIYIILILFMFACEELEEQTTPLSGIFYVFEGWNAFMEQDYDRAKELFSATLLADEGSETNYYDYAYAGLGWTAIYKANVNPGINNRTLRENLRSESIDHFESADAGVQLRLDAENMNNLDSLLYANVMAGRSSLLYYLSKDLEVDYYNDGFDESLRNDASLSYKKMISESDTLLNQFPLYEFQYDINININFIRHHRAASFYRLSDLESDNVDVEINYLDSTIIEIGLFTDIYCDLSQILIPACLALTSPMLNQ